MRKIVVSFLILCCLCMFVPIAAHADGLQMEFNWQDYTLDELLEIQEGLSVVISEKQREYAIEHGDRKISLPEESTVYVGGTVTLEPTVEKVLDTAPDVTRFVWSSSDESVATVAANGAVRGVGKGEAIITCTAADSEFIFAETKVEAVLPVSGLAIPEQIKNALIFEGKDNGVQLSCVVSPEDAWCQDVVWSSSNEAIATVDENGYVSLVAPGNVTISVKSQDSFSAAPKEARLALTVQQAASSITLDQTSVVMNKGSYLALKASILPENTSNKSLVWESSAPEIVTVANGQLRAVACGKATITCTAADGGGAQTSCEVEVIQMVTGIRILDVKQPQTLDMNSSLKLKTDITPADATNKKLTWSSSDKTIVTVSDTGEIKAVGGGTAVITCTAADGSGKTASVTVFVPSIAVTRDEYTVVSKDGLTFEVWFYGQLGKFNIYPTSNAYFTAKYTYHNDNKYSVSITPLKAGRGTITLQDNADAKSNRTITITIDHSAVYDSIGYPKANYAEILRNPNSYKGHSVSIYGKVLQVGTSWGTTWARIGTGGYGYYDNVFYVTIPYSAMDENIIEDDMITVYGECTGTETYTTIFGASVTIPSITAEKVMLGLGS